MQSFFFRKHKLFAVSSLLLHKVQHVKLWASRLHRRIRRTFGKHSSTLDWSFEKVFTCQLHELRKKKLIFLPILWNIIDTKIQEKTFYEIYTLECSTCRDDVSFLELRIMSLVSLSLMPEADSLEWCFAFRLRLICKKCVKWAECQTQNNFAVNIWMKFFNSASNLMQRSSDATSQYYQVSFMLSTLVNTYLFTKISQRFR